MSNIQGATELNRPDPNNKMLKLTDHLDIYLPMPQEDSHALLSINETHKYMMKYT